MEVLKQRYLGAWETQEKNISDKFDQIFMNTKKIDHLVNNVACKNPKVNNKLAPVIQNMFVVYQRELIEGIIDDLLLEEVVIQNELEKIKDENGVIIKEAQLKGDVSKAIQEAGLDGA